MGDLSHQVARQRIRRVRSAGVKRGCRFPSRRPGDLELEHIRMRSASADIVSPRLRFVTLNSDLSEDSAFQY